MYLLASDLAASPSKDGFSPALRGENPSFVGRAAKSSLVSTIGRSRRRLIRRLRKGAVLKVASGDIEWY